jgi:phytanoyl-CoA hydroxylase
MSSVATRAVPVTRAVSDGYFVVENLVSADDCRRLADRLNDYASGARSLPSGVAVQREPGLGQHDERQTDGTDIRKVSGVYNDDLFSELVNGDGICRRMRILLGKELRLFRADALMKPPIIGSEKGVHQDSSNWPIEPMSLWSCWVPLDDSTLDNGCMMVIPGSHRDGLRPHVHMRNDYLIEEGRYDVDALEPVPMRRGSGLFFHSLVVHGTAANTSAKPRRAVTMTYMGSHHRNSGSPATKYPAVG